MLFVFVRDLALRLGRKEGSWEGLVGFLQAGSRPTRRPVVGRLIGAASAFHIHLAGFRRQFAAARHRPAHAPTPTKLGGGGEEKGGEAFMVLKLTTRYPPFQMDESELLSYNTPPRTTSLFLLRMYAMLPGLYVSTRHLGRRAVQTR